jgi:hypothetical protein
MAELTRRYVVMTMATQAPFDPLDPEGVFVLKPWKDPAALRAVAAYRDNCYPELARDLDGWIRAIEAGPAVRGDVGRRNEAFVKIPAAPAGNRGGARPRTRAATRPSAASKARARPRRAVPKRKKRRD